MNNDLTENMKVCIMPTWEQNTMMLCMILRDGTSEGQEHAQQEIIRMAKILDKMRIKRPNS